MEGPAEDEERVVFIYFLRESAPEGGDQRRLVPIELPPLHENRPANKHRPGVLPKCFR